METIDQVKLAKPVNELKVLECLERCWHEVSASCFARRFNMNISEVLNTLESLVKQQKVTTNGLYGSYKKYRIKN